MREGHVRRSLKRKREQKAVDVQLAVDALEHAARSNMTMAILLTGDLDFEPLLGSLERMGVRTRLAYVPRHTSTDLLRAADEIRKITLQHFYSWSAPSFRANHKTVKLEYGQGRPEPPIFEPCREGVWDGRQVTLFKTINQAAPRLYAEWGNELTEPSYTFEHPEIDKLPLAFELTFGEIEWSA